ncbi:AIPR family protein [Lysinibacillus antri]|uniref:Abortive phage infection protein n=1 Tax=Lysinibacillus antri TaxID=2498145 RepID=A0A3S0QQD8_9BACI|nr:AIPR family protein [Lysinibacillus antri]RUL53947.1 abortive phage infection protein [Lysinibacillus antri]
MATIEEFHIDFLQTILSEADSRGLFNSQSFYEIVCEELVSTGELTVNYTEADYLKIGGRSPMEACGYDFDEERGILSVLVHQFYQTNTIETITRQTIEQKFNRVKNFIISSFEGLYKKLEQTSPAYSMTYFIFSKFERKEIKKIRLFLVSDGKITRTFRSINAEGIAGITLEYRIVDIEYLYKNHISQNSDSSFEVEMNLPCLRIPIESDKYSSYLSYFTGDQLVDIYENFGQRLLEQNVRTFLQFKGGVNKGIRNTIEGAPEMFFAYNNGITATASKLEFDHDGNIRKIHNLQIVNGGQTTSSIYAAKKNAKLDVSNVTVQMKISVVGSEENHSDFVSKVAEYANTQNKVNKSDFFSNSPFHKEFKQYSSRLWAPMSSGSQKMTRWFYERVRGEYLNEQAYLTKAKQKQFQLENPKSQVVDKTFLSKSENAWLQKPDIVCRGAQYSFADFAVYITDLLEKDNLAITENYFKDSIARVILFKAVEKLISQSDWYNGGYRAQTVAYTISYLSWFTRSKQKKYFNFNEIWTSQKIEDDLIDVLKVVTKEVYNSITNPPFGHANVSQWCKKQECWKEIKKMNIEEIKIPSRYYLESEEVQYIKKEVVTEKKMDSGIEIQTFVYELGVEKWNRLYEYFSLRENRSTITLTQFDILKKVAKGNIVLPSEKQANILFKLYEKAINEGLIL